MSETLELSNDRRAWMESTIDVIHNVESKEQKRRSPFKKLLKKMSGKSRRKAKRDKQKHNNTKNGVLTESSSNEQKDSQNQSQIAADESKVTFVTETIPDTLAEKRDENTKPTVVAEKEDTSLSNTETALRSQAGNGDNVKMLFKGAGMFCAAVESIPQVASLLKYTVTGR